MLLNLEHHIKFIPYVPSSTEINRFQQLEAGWFEQGRVESNVFQNMGIPGSVEENPQFLAILKKANLMRRKFKFSILFMIKAQ